MNANKPLHGYTILITRAAAQSPKVIDRIHELGGTTENFPMIEITEPDSWDMCDRAIITMKKYDAVIFTSANAVRGFVHRIENNFPQAKDILNRRTVYAVGSKTNAALTDHGIETDAVPETYTADAVVALITKSGAAGKSFLLPAGNLTRDVIEKKLMRAEAVVDRIRVYATKKPDTINVTRLEQLVRERKIDIITFFSPSSVHHFFELIDPAPIRNIPVAVIGSTTADAVTGYGIRPKIQPDEATGDALVDSIVKYKQYAEQPGL
jgi:uroporphyrinogen-III synthase